MCLNSHNCYNSISVAVVYGSAAALKCNGYGLESWLAGHLHQGSVHWRGAWYVNVWDSVCWEGVYTEDAIFFN